MTESLATTYSHSAHPDSGAAVDSTAAANDVNASSAGPSAEEQGYTLKCICGFVDADQQTVYCESCDSWQHTECYYMNESGFCPTEAELESLEHLCYDCKPRRLDIKGATDRQKARQDQLELNEKRQRKNATKSHKRKTKTTDGNGVLANGWSHGGEADAQHDRTSGSPRDNPAPSKRLKTSHRSSNNNNAIAANHEASSKSHKRNASHAQSPVKASHRRVQSSEDLGETCSVDFVHLYDSDPGETPMQTNLMNDIHITSALALWTNDIEALREATPKFSHPDIFQRTEQPISSMQMPDIRKQEREGEMVIDGKRPKWKYITVDSWTPKGALVAEIKGKIGHMMDYIQEPANRWDHLRHPAPFVFFHPRLPIYIDTRSEGTLCRYLRRSCSPNVAMKTFLENGSEYHFCFIAERDIEQDAELTMGWVPDEYMRRFFDPNSNMEKEEVGPDYGEYIRDWVIKVMPEFGGCACGSSHCTWNGFINRTHAAFKGRNGHGKGANSNSVTNHLVGNGDGSEQEDPRSSSDSKSASRDNTPTDGNGTLGAGLEISAREKRKIALLEKNFEQLENDKHQPSTKKKKRSSGGSNLNTSSSAPTKSGAHGNSTASQPNTPGFPKPQYADASTSGRRSGSPALKHLNNTPVPARPRPSAPTNGKAHPSLSGTSTSVPKHHKNYVTCGTQTDPVDDDDDWKPPATVPTQARRPYVSVVKRLLMRSQQERQQLEQKRRASLEASNAASKVTQAVTVPGTGAQSQPKSPTDTEMQDSLTPLPTDKAVFSPSLSHGQEINHDLDKAYISQSPAPLLASVVSPTTNITANPIEVNGPVGPTDLPGQPPPKPPESSTMTGAKLVETPTSTTGPESPMSTTAPSTAQPVLQPTPANSLPNIQPSPVPKKMSLSDYLKRKGSSSGAAGKSGGIGGGSGGIMSADKTSGKPSSPDPVQHQSLSQVQSPSKLPLALISEGDGAIVDSKIGEGNDAGEKDGVSAAAATTGAVPIASAEANGPSNGAPDNATAVKETDVKATATEGSPSTPTEPATAVKAEPSTSASDPPPTTSLNNTTSKDDSAVATATTEAPAPLSSGENQVDQSKHAMTPAPTASKPENEGTKEDKDGTVDDPTTGVVATSAPTATATTTKEQQTNESTSASK